MQQEKRPVEIVVKCLCDGFAFDLSAELCVDQIEGLMKKLSSAGVTPAHSPYLMTPSASNGGTGDGLAPLCPTHGSRMKPSKKGGGWFCPRKLDDGSYCREKVA